MSEEVRHNNDPCPRCGGQHVEATHDSVGLARAQASAASRLGFEIEARTWRERAAQLELEP